MPFREMGGNRKGQWGTRQHHSKESQKKPKKQALRHLLLLKSLDEPAWTECGRKFAELAATSAIQGGVRYLVAVLQQGEK